MRKKEEEEEKERANFSVFWIESLFIDFKYKNRIIGEKFSAWFIDTWNTNRWKFLEKKVKRRI